MVLYLSFNAVLYLVLALWCIVLPAKTSAAVGFSLIPGSGQSEYLVVYGGLQIGLAVFFALTAWNPEWHRVGIYFAASLYVPIFACRVISLFRYGNIGVVTYATAALEAVLTIWVAILLWQQRI